MDCSCPQHATLHHLVLSQVPTGGSELSNSEDSEESEAESEQEEDSTSGALATSVQDPSNGTPANGNRPAAPSTPALPDAPVIQDESSNDSDSPPVRTLRPRKASASKDPVPPVDNAGQKESSESDEEETTDPKASRTVGASPGTEAPPAGRRLGSARAQAAAAADATSMALAIAGEDLKRIADTLDGLDASNEGVSTGVTAYTNMMRAMIVGLNSLGAEARATASSVPKTGRTKRQASAIAAPSPKRSKPPASKVSQRPSQSGRTVLLETIETEISDLMSQQCCTFVKKEPGLSQPMCTTPRQPLYTDDVLGTVRMYCRRYMLDKSLPNDVESFLCDYISILRDLSFFDLDSDAERGKVSSLPFVDSLSLN